MSKLLRVLFDADYLTYAAGFAVESTDYLLTVGPDTVYGMYGGMEAAKEAMKIAGEAWGDHVKLWKHGPYLEEDGERRAKYNVKSMIEGALEALQNRYPQHVLSKELYLTGSGNFRDAVATIRPYKGNRATASKPLLYRELRQYLVEVWGAKIVHGIEADDIIATRAEECISAKEEYVVVHVDKDLLMIPGVHYNPNKGWATVSRERGLREFYRQLITGDSTDNIPGVYRAGPKVAKEVIVSGMTEGEMWKTVVQLYADSQAKHGPKCGYAHMTPYDAALENSRLLWLQTFPGELWTPPKAADKEAA